MGIGILGMEKDNTGELRQEWNFTSISPQQRRDKAGFLQNPKANVFPLMYLHYYSMSRI